jgi:S-adenosylmethionine decarboxylase
MILKELDLNNYLFGTNTYELGEEKTKEIENKLYHEMREIYYGRNMPK